LTPAASPEQYLRPMTSKVLMIGLDGASVDFILSSLPSLPNLRRAIEQGRLSRLRSPTSELLPAASWPTLYTGVPPGIHGIYYPMQWDADGMRMRHINGWLYAEPFWYELERRGCRVMALDVPLAWPSRLQRGLEVTDWGTHDRLGEFSAGSTALASDIRRRFGTYPISREIPVKKSWDQLARMRDQLVDGARRKGELAHWMAGLNEWDFFVVVFGETHRGGHLFWPTPEAEGVRHPPGALLSVYQAVDNAIGRLLETVNLDDTTLIIVSAHGMAANASQEHFTRLIMDRVNRHFSGNGHAPGNGPRQLSAMRFLRERLPARVLHTLGQVAPNRVRNYVVDRAITSGHDWLHTPALAVLASVTGYVRFNLRGRESRGMLDPGSEMFGRYARWVHESFLGFQNVETGVPLVNAITRTREAFPGPRQDLLPDLVVSWTPVDRSVGIHSARLGAIKGGRPTGRAGNHHPDGFTIVMERNGERGVATTAGDLVDVKPMVFRRLLERV